MTEHNYIDEKRYGSSTTWYENGQKKTEITYQDGKIFLQLIRTFLVGWIIICGEIWYPISIQLI